MHCLGLCVSGLAHTRVSASTHTSSCLDDCMRDEPLLLVPSLIKMTMFWQGPLPQVKACIVHYPALHFHCRHHVQAYWLECRVHSMFVGCTDLSRCLHAGVTVTAEHNLTTSSTNANFVSAGGYFVRCGRVVTRPYASMQYACIISLG